MPQGAHTGTHRFDLLLDRFRLKVSNFTFIQVLLWEEALLFRFPTCSSILAPLDYIGTVGRPLFLIFISTGVFGG